MPLPLSIPLYSLGLSDEQIQDRFQYSGEADRRRYPRVGNPKLAVLLRDLPPDKSGAFLIRTKDISCGGLAFRHPSEIVPGTRCRVKVMFLSGEVIAMGGRIVRCRPLGGEGYEIGLEFDEELRVPELAED